ncbi:MAG: hypothetical protein KC619_08045 [Myxococcales bacterium]|nr:hypothetical protein [Myxococcales bacterium]
MPRFDAGDVDVLYRSSALVLTHWENVMVQYRTGPLTPEGLRHVASTARLVRTRRKGKVGLIALLAEDAPMPSTETRKLQRSLIREMMADERSYIVGVARGESTAAHLLRSALRLIVPGLQRMEVCADMTAAARWLAPRLAQTEDDLKALADHTVTLAT